MPLPPLMLIPPLPLGRLPQRHHRAMSTHLPFLGRLRLLLLKVMRMLPLKRRRRLLLLCLDMLIREQWGLVAVRQRRLLKVTRMLLLRRRLLL